MSTNINIFSNTFNRSTDIDRGRLEELVNCLKMADFSIRISELLPKTEKTESAEKSLSSALSIRDIISKYSNNFIHLDIPENFGTNLFLAISQQCIAENCSVFISGLTKLESKQLLLPCSPNLKNGNFNWTPEEKKEIHEMRRRSIQFHELLSSIQNISFLSTSAKQKIRNALEQKKINEDFFSETELSNIFLLRKCQQRYSGIARQLLNLILNRNTDKQHFGILCAHFLIGHIPLRQISMYFSDFLTIPLPRNKTQFASFSHYFNALAKNIRQHFSSEADLAHFLKKTEGFLIDKRSQIDPRIASQIHFINRESVSKNTFLNERRRFFCVLNKAMKTAEDGNNKNKAEQDFWQLFYDDLLKLLEKFKNLQGSFLTHEMDKEKLSALQEYFKSSAVFPHYKEIIEALKKNTGIFSIENYLQQKKSLVDFEEIKIFLRRLANFLCPFYSELLESKEKFSTSSTKDTNRKRSIINENFDFLVRQRFALISKEIASTPEPQIFKGAKKQLGLDSLKHKEEPIPQYSYDLKKEHNPVIVDLEPKAKFPAIPVQYFQKLYCAFIDQEIIGTLREIASNESDIFKKDLNLFLYRTYRYLTYRKNVYVGYSQFYEVHKKNFLSEKANSFEKEEGIHPKKTNDPFTNPFYEDQIFSALKENTVGIQVSGHFKQQKKKFLQHIERFNNIGVGEGLSAEISVIYSIIVSLHQKNIFDLYHSESRRMFKKIEYASAIWTEISTFLFENNEHIPVHEKEIYIFLPSDFDFLLIFQTSSNVKIEYTNYLVHLVSDQESGKKQHSKLNVAFLNFLKQKKEPLNEVLQSLKNIYSIITEYQRHWIALQQATSLYLTLEIFLQYAYLPVKTNMHKVDIIETKLEKLVVTNDKKLIFDAKIRSSKTSGFLYIPYLKFFSGLNSLKTVEVQKRRYHSLLRDFEFYLSCFPTLEDGAKELFPLREKLQELSQIMQKTPAGLDRGNINHVSLLSRETPSLYKECLYQENMLPKECHYFQKSLHRFSETLNNNEKNEFLALISGILYRVSGDEDKKHFFVDDLLNAVQFIEFLNRRKIILIFPDKTRSSLLESYLPTLIEQIGLKAKIYVEEDSLASVSKNILTRYIPEHQFFSKKYF